MSNQPTSPTEIQTLDPKRGAKGGCGAGWGCECRKCKAARAAEAKASETANG